MHASGVSEPASHDDEGWVNPPRFYFSGLVEGELSSEVDDAVRRSMGWKRTFFC